MKSFLALTLMAAVVAGTTNEPDIDVDAVFENERLYQQYYKCFMDEGKCTPNGKVIKANFPRMINNQCNNCTPKQVEDTKSTIQHMIKDKPKDYEAFEKKWDPKLTLRKKYAPK